jgi:hypothetical protein
LGVSSGWRFFGRRFFRALTRFAFDRLDWLSSKRGAEADQQQGCDRRQQQG